MNVFPITQKVPVCLGVCCELHHKCQRYEAVNGATYQPRIGTCSEDGKDRPLFVALEAA